jgi:hypothetical protein
MNNISVRLADNAGTYKLSILDSDGAEVAYVDSNGAFVATSFTPTTFVLPTATTPEPTTEGEMWWDTDDNVLRIGDGASTVTLDPAASAVNHNDLATIGTDDHHGILHGWADATDHNGTAWRMVYTNGSGVIIELGLGASGYHLRSNGAAAAPTWEAVAGTHATNHSDGQSDEVTVENLATSSADTSSALRPDGAGGLAFSDINLTDAKGGNWKTIHTNATGVVTELSLGTSTYVLTANGAAAAPTWQDPKHKATHITAGTDEIDGDQLDIDWNPSNYTPSTSPTETTSVDHLTSHLYGIDQAISDVHSSTSAIVGILDGAGAAIAAGTIIYIEVPFACTITQHTLLADVSGSVTVRIWKDTYANYPPLAADDISNGGTAISTATKAQDATLTSWTTSISAGDIIAMEVQNIATTITRVTSVLKVTKT